MLKNNSQAQELLEKGTLLVGTIDTYIMWQLSGRTIYKIDYTNESRTMLFNIKTLSYDQLCNIFNIDKKILPEVVASGSIFGNTDKDILGFEVPICGVAGDQQAALWWNCCQ